MGNNHFSLDYRFKENVQFCSIDTLFQTVKCWENALWRQMENLCQILKDIKVFESILPFARAGSEQCYWPCLWEGVTSISVSCLVTRGALCNSSVTSKPLLFFSVSTTCYCSLQWIIQKKRESQCLISVMALKGFLWFDSICPVTFSGDVLPKAKLVIHCIFYTNFLLLSGWGWRRAWGRPGVGWATWWNQ